MSTTGRLIGRISAREFGVLALELLLLVAGILFALALDRRIQEIEENEILVASLTTLRGDLDAVLTQIGEFSTFEEDRLEASGVVHDALLQPTIPRTFEVWNGFRTLGSRRTLALPRAGYDELLSTGHLRFVDPELRRSITRYYEYLIRAQAISGRNNEAFTDDLYNRFFVGEGMVLFPAPDIDSPVELQNRATELRQQAGIGTELTYQGRVWVMAPTDPDRMRARAIVMWSSQSASVGIILAEDIEERTLELIAELDRALESA
ncbi:MAG TPA: hypothetical protein VJ925_03475 [Longimicrobiales bacterium]|nr:hypothetical protein [Longimicrobiales bacterium]